MNFDAASSTVLAELAAEGRLPTLVALQEDGVRIPLESLGSRFPAATYPTIYTGLELGRHGLYYPFQWLPWEQRVFPLARLPTPATLWERVSDAGGRVLVLDPYEARLPQALDGVFLSGWQFRNRVVLPAASIPRTEYLRHALRHGRGAVVEEIFGPRSARLLRGLRRNLVGASDRLATVAGDLLRRERFDLAWITVTPVHLAGHQFWRDRDTLADVYSAADRALGRIVDALPAGSDLIVFSAQGMDDNVSRVHMLPGMLAAVLDGRHAPGRALWGIRGLVPTSVRAAAARALPPAAALELTTRLETRGTDWWQVRAFTLPSDSTGYVRLNLRGRERNGVVPPGEIDALCEEIAAGLLTFRDPDGAPSIAAVERTPDGAPRRDLLPDLVVVWNRRPGAACLSSVSSSQHGEVRGPEGGSGRTGDHDSDAWAILVSGGRRARERRSPARLIDLTATACAPFGAADGMTGRSLLAS